MLEHYVAELSMIFSPSERGGFHRQSDLVLCKLLLTEDKTKKI